MAKVFFQTHGCSTNFSETEVMQGLLSKAEFEIINDKEKADVIVINVCTVKGENTALKEIRKMHEEYPGKRIIAAGCITPELLTEIKMLDEGISSISTHNIKSIVEVLEEVINGEVVDLIAYSDSDLKICLPRVRHNPVVSIVPISSGCNMACAYCSVRLIKGNLKSYPEESIIEEVSKAVTSGCKEIWITSQDTAGYGTESGNSRLAALLDKICEIKGDFRVRVGMMNPTHVLPVLDSLVKSFEHEKVFNFLHLPIQSGNNEILKSMNRRYGVEEFKMIIDRFKEKIPNLTLSTDIIVGYPGESEEQFTDSLNLIKEITPDVLNISRFIPRSGTKSAEEEQLNGGIIANRSRLLTEIFHNIARMQHEKWYNWEGSVLIDEYGKDDSFVARNDSYKPVILKGDLKLGQRVNVKIENTTTFDLRGCVLSIEK